MLKFSIYSDENPYVELFKNCVGGIELFAALKQNLRLKELLKSKLYNLFRFGGKNMTKKPCVECGWPPVSLDFSEGQRLMIWYLLQQELNLFAIDKIQKTLDIDLETAKAIRFHLNAQYGLCVHCSNTGLKGENVYCPNCAAFNYNWLINPSFNQDFCDHLEYHIDFSRLDEKAHRFWCDGVDHLPDDIASISKESVKQNKEIITKAWTGASGQEIYTMKIKLGPKALKYYQNGKDLIECLPRETNSDWVLVDSEEEYIEIILN